MRRKLKPAIECIACKVKFQYNCQLRYHIRRHHFNRIGVAPFYEAQNVNEVWVEKVANTNVLVEMKKIGENCLLIKKLKDDPNTQPTELKEELIDLREQYPLLGKTIKKLHTCRVCHLPYGTRQLAKHFASSHPELVKKRCDVCDVHFKRLMQCAMHICPAGINKKLKKENDEWIVID